MSTGPILLALARAYAATIARLLASGDLPQFDVLFGPAYKGIPFGACTTLMLASEHNLNIGFAYDRKEAKDHGEGGVLVGAPVKGKRVLLLDDVMTAGTAVRGAIKTVETEGGSVVGVVQCLDREEVGQDGKSSTAAELAKVFGGTGRVAAILKMRDLMAWLEAKKLKELLGQMQGYWEQYGYKG